MGVKLLGLTNWALGLPKEIGLGELGLTMGEG